MNISTFLKEQGYETLPDTWYVKIEEWRSWYRGKIDRFHRYNQYNGLKMVARERQTLGMAKQVCEDKADLLLNEKVTINVSDEAAQAYLDDVLEDNQFSVRGNMLIELMAALGTAAIVEYIEGKEIKLDYIQAPMIFPLAWRGQYITECAFASEFHQRGGKCMYINMHVKDAGGNYIVKNFMINEAGKQIDLPEGLLPEYITGSDTPLFQILRLNAVNNVDTTNPMGLALFANAIDILKGLDLVYDSYDNEFRLGKKRILVRDSAIRVVSNGEGAAVVPIFDDNDTEFYAMSMSDTEDSVKEINMTLRSAEHEIALKSRLDILSEKCGFGKGYYKFEADSVQTATGVISQNSQLYRKIKKDELILEAALLAMTDAIFYLAKKIGAKTPEPGDVSISFDDSIIEDTDAVAKRSLLELQNGIIGPAEYLMRVYKITQEQADEIVAAALEGKPEPPDTNPEILVPNQSTTPGAMMPAAGMNGAKQIGGEGTGPGSDGAEG